MSTQQEPQNQFQHHLTAAVIIAGTQKGQVDTHGGNQEGGHITATFGLQLMVTMLDREGALAFAKAWTNPGEPVGLQGTAGERRAGGRRR